MTPTQEYAIRNIVRTQEQIQAAWDKPRMFKIPTLINRAGLIVTVVVHDKRGYHWMTCVRIYHLKKHKVKPPEDLSLIERAQVGLILNSELMGVGHEEDVNFFDSQWALHMEKKVTGAELGEALKPDITGNGHKPKITSQGEATALLDKLEAQLKDKASNLVPFIKPNLN